MEKLIVHSKSHNYPVFIDDSLDQLIQDRLNFADKYYFIMDENLPSNFKRNIKLQFNNSYFYEVAGGESAKTFEQYEIILNNLLNADFSKNDTIVSIGGGTLGDLTGYVASSYKRGMNFIYIPTTTLSMVDSCVGGKNAINFGNIKNSVGSIYPPKEVLIGIDILSSLNDRLFNDGLFEALKMGILFDKKLFGIFKEGKYREQLKDIILLSLERKIEIVEQDEFEFGNRKLLNFGHTIGHAIEIESNYSIFHGEAIANGILKISKEKPYYNDLIMILKNMNCPIYKIKSIEGIIETIKNDKKFDGNFISFVVCDDICTNKIEKLTLEELKGFID